MALIQLHKVMIGAAVLFCALFSVRGFVTGDVVIGGLFGAVTVGLSVYFRWFLAKRGSSSEAE